MLLAAFVLVERHQRLPMLDLSLFRSGAFAGANLVAMLVSLGMFGVFFFVSLYIQNILGFSPTKAGAAFLPMTMLIILVAPIAGRASDRVGPRWLMGAGMSILGVSLLFYQRVGLHSDFWTLLPAMLLGGVGMALTMSPMTAAAMGAVPVDKAGVGSGVLNSFRQVGGAMGIAVMGAIVASYVHAGSRTALGREQFVNGLHAALLVSAGLAFAGAVVAIAVVRTAPQVERAHVGGSGGGGGMTPAATRPPDRGRAPPRARPDRAARLHGGELPRDDDRGDRPRRGRLRADPLPPLRLEARPLPRRARPRLGQGAHVVGGGARRHERRRARRSSRSAAGTTPCATASSSSPSCGCRRSSEASEDPELRRHLRRHMREVHDFMAGVIRRGQEQGVLHATATPTRRRGSSSPAASSAWSAAA